MKFYIIPTDIVEQYQGFQKQNFAINFTQTNKGVWVINQNCGEPLFTEINWKSFDVIELNQEDFVPDTNRPKYHPFYVEIPETMLFIFPEDKFICNDFVVELTVVENKRYVNTAYLKWFSFQQELDKVENAPLKRSLGAVWKYVEKEIENKNIITL